MPSRRSRAPWAALLFVLVATAGAEAKPLAVPSTIQTRNVPVIDTGSLVGLLPYENIRSAALADWHPTERRMLIGTRFAQSRQVHEVASPLAARNQLTFYDEPVGFAAYRPGNPRQIVFQRDEGGNENFQIFLLDRATGTTRRLSDGQHRYLSVRWSPNGRQLAYTSNARNGRDSDIYLFDLDAGTERRLVELSGSWNISDWSRDGARLLIQRYVSAAQSELHAIEIADGRRSQLSPADARPTVFSDGHWAADNASVYAVSDRDNEFTRLVRFDAKSTTWKNLSGDRPWDVEEIALSQDGTVLAYTVNEDGYSRLVLHEVASGREREIRDLPGGVINGLRFRDGSHELAFTLTWARGSGDVYSLDADRVTIERWTESETGGLITDRLPIPDLVRFPTFDQRSIPAFVYRPDEKRFPGKRPVLISIHGGPEGQSRPSFRGSESYFADELGITTIFPNVRGSTGYGRTFLALDNGRLREDSVRDIGALLDWIATQPDFDASRVMVMGGSYGGYMTLASLVHYSDRLAGGYDSVGISNWVTFLSHTEAYRQDLRRVEYGDERDPEMRAFLESISPLNHVEKIRKPLLVAQGANDPRVPRGESEQIVNALESRGTTAWYILAADEGHGFRKKGNSDYLRAAAIEFIRRHLLAPATP